MALPRFLVDRLEQQGSVQLDESESHHAARVLRLSAGDSCVLFDGVGHEADGIVESADKKRLIVAYHSRVFAPRDHNGTLHFGIAMPKGDRQRNVIEKLVELGIDRLTPLHTDRSVSKFDQGAIERLVRYSTEACKQCHRNRFMQIDACCHWQDWLDQTCNPTGNPHWVLHPAKSQESVKEVKDHRANDSERASNIETQTSILDANLSQDRRMIFSIGPEGGFTKEEIAQAIQRGVRILDLGERILRVETAVSAAAVLASYRLQRTIADSGSANSTP